MTETCDGSLGAPGERPRANTFLPTARCEACGKFVEIHPTNPEAGPYSEDVWRLEMHDVSGQTLRVEPSPNPEADALVPERCERCDSTTLTIIPRTPDLLGRCDDCGHEWLTGHLNETAG